MIEWPEELIDDIAKRKIVLYLGSGVSANSENDEGKRPATWKAFLENILTKRGAALSDVESTVRALLEKNDYLMACEVIVNTIGNRAFGELAADEFRRPGYRPGELHKVIFALDSRIVITPNIDKIYDQYAISSSNGTVIIKDYKENIAKYLRSPDYIIIKAHGTVDDTEHIVFTHGQYGKIRNEYSSFYKILDALMLTHTFVFLGCGVSDPDIQLILENYNFSFPGCRPHYMITSQDTLDSNIVKCLSNNRNLEFLHYDNPDGTHALLLENLKCLEDLVAERRHEIASTISW